ncbi:MAG: hypothetical protein EOP62_18720 [Sphingomonadales bacterium]|nr:MAG: hypothetical protein EOP62_18720 [Sphingomonadales bacterium]
MHIINRDNYGEANEAIRDILMMYVDLASATEGFGHAAAVHIRFDPLHYVDADAAADGYHYVDLELLRSGSAIAILCAFYDLWCEEQSLDGHPNTLRYQEALERGRLSGFPDVEAIIREAIKRNDMPVEDPWLDAAVLPIYRNYVLAFFNKLSVSDRGTTEAS